MALLTELVVEFTVLVLPEQYRPDHGKGVALKQLKPLIESIVDIDFAIPSNY